MNMNARTKKHIIGIDPGTILMGYGVLACGGKKPELVAMGVLKLDRYKSHYERLRKIYDGVVALINRYEPEALAIEAPFYGKNVQTTLKLGRAQGAAMVAAISQGLTVEEYAPSSIKKAITGSGSASKEQVAALLKHILHIPEEAMMAELDATDGVAVALCHHIHQTSPLPTKSKSANSWADYIRNNPEKVVK